MLSETGRDQDASSEDLMSALPKLSVPLHAGMTPQDCVAAAMAAERAGRVQTGRGADAVEGRQAFLEKRPPVFNR